MFCGYAATGFLLFGHQFEGMSTLELSMMTLFMILMDFDASKFWPQMTHSAGEAAFHMFLWSYIIVAYFILMNMLLAIIVDSYAHVKEQTEGSLGLSTDLGRVMWHGFRRMLSVCGTSSFISDQEMLRALQEELKLLGAENEVSKKEVAKGIVDVHQQHGHHQVVLLPGAKSVNKTDMARLVRFVPFVHSSAGSCCGAGRGMPSSEWLQDSAEASVLAGGDAVLDLMQRYGNDLAEFQEKRDKEILHMIQIENHRRVLALQMGQAKLLDEARQIVDMVKNVYGTAATTSKLGQARQSIFNTVPGTIADDWSSPLGKLEVTVVRASKLPKMDIFRKSDPYWYLSIYLSINQSIYLSIIHIYICIHLYICIYINACPHLCMSFYTSKTCIHTSTHKKIQATTQIQVAV